MMIYQWNRTLRHLFCLQRLTSTSRAAAAANAQVSSTLLNRSASNFAIMEQTTLNYEEAIEALKRSKLLAMTSDKSVRETGAKLNALGIPPEDISKYPEVLAVLALTLDNHAKLLYECGFNTVTAHHLALYHRIMTKRLSLLKAHNYLQNDDPSILKILQKVPGIPTSVAEEIERNIGPVDDESNLRDLHKQIVLHYLCWRLQGTPKQINRIMEIYVKIRNKSLAVMAESIDLLINELGFTQERILKHGYLIHSYSDQTRATLERVPVLGGLSLKEVAHKYPRVLFTNTDALINTTNVLKQFGISDESISKCLKIYTLSTKTIRNRLINVMNDPQLSGFLGHPRILFLILNNTTAKKRLAILHALQMQCFSLNLISASSKRKFVRFTTDGEDLNRGDDIVHYISESLSCDPSKLRQELKRLSHWNTVPLANVRATMLVLAERKFTPQQIYNAVHLLLYPADQVKDILDSINYYTPREAIDWSPKLRYEHFKVETGQSKPSSREVTHNEYTGSNACKEVLEAPHSDDTVVIEWRFVLQHCLYLLEKPHHFTGNGIWAHNSSKDDREVATLTA